MDSESTAVGVNVGEVSGLDSDSSEEVEEDIEPKLTYDRIINDVGKILKTDSATCVAVHSKFLVLGTSSGKIHILDHQGNSCRKDLSLHSSRVSQISLDQNGEYFASCSAEKVVICELCNPDNCAVFPFENSGAAVAIDPLFSRGGNNRRCITGDDKVILYERGFLTRYKATILQQSYGVVRNIKWHSYLVAWANDFCVKIFDMNERVVITVIKRDHDEIYQPEIYRCLLCWKAEGVLLVGWADSVKVCVVKNRNPADLKANLPRKYVEITSMFNTDFCICGIADMDQNIVTLAMSKEYHDIKGISAGKLQLLVIEPQRTDYDEISSDILSPKGFRDWQSCDYHLEWVADEGLYFIVCPKDVILAKPREEDDHITWLLQHGRFDQALEFAKTSKNLKNYSLYTVGLSYIDHLLEQNDLQSFEKAAKLCASTIRNDSTAWERQVEKFKEKGQLRLLAPYIPVVPPMTLKPETYKLVLQEFLTRDPEGALKLIRKWPHKIYEISSLTTAILQALDSDPKNTHLLEALAEMHTFEGKHDKALAVYLEIGNRTQVFDLIRKFGLYDTLQEKLELFMNLNAMEASKLLIENQEKVLPDYVVSKLKHKPELLWKYLDRLIHKDMDQYSQYHNLLVELYVHYAPEKLLPFLKRSIHCSLEKALGLCRKENLIPEVVFLLGRMGNSKEALQYIMNSMNDIDYAIEFSKEHSDPELWEDLIAYSLKKPSFVRVLLRNIGTHIHDPISLIERIPDDMKIEGLMPALVKILNDYNLQVCLQGGCNSVLVSDSFKLLEKLNKQQKRAISVNEGDICQGCRRKVFVSEIRYASDLIVFNCRHIFHEECVPTSTQQLLCSICMASKS